jgi:hypothetical protein
MIEQTSGFFENSEVFFVDPIFLKGYYLLM